MIDDDSDLRSRFERMKADDARSVRPFFAYTGSDRRRWSLQVAPILAALTLILMLAVGVHLRSARRVSGDRISEWRSPTASLLKTPGRELFTSLPRISSFKEQRN